MAGELTRRGAIGMGAFAAAAATLAVTGRSASASPEGAAPGGAAPGGAAQGGAAPGGRARIRRAYQRGKAAAGGSWHAHIAIVNAAGGLDVAGRRRRRPGHPRLQRAEAGGGDRGPGQGGPGRAEPRPASWTCPASIILGGSGIYHLHGVWGDEHHGRQLPDRDAAGLGQHRGAACAAGWCPRWRSTRSWRPRASPTPGSSRWPTPTGSSSAPPRPRETHDLLWRLANRTLLSPASCDFLLRRHPVGQRLPRRRPARHVVERAQPGGHQVRRGLRRHRGGPARGRRHVRRGRRAGADLRAVRRRPGRAGQLRRLRTRPCGRTPRWAGSCWTRWAPPRTRPPPPANR